MRTLADHFDRSCFRKVQHPDKETAVKEAQRMSLVEREDFVAYHCSCCGQWHVGHKERREDFA